MICFVSACSRIASEASNPYFTGGQRQLRMICFVSACSRIASEASNPYFTGGQRQLRMICFVYYKVPGVDPRAYCCIFILWNLLIFPGQGFFAVRIQA
jgi:hypothetical protein